MTDSLAERYKINKRISGFITLLFCLFYYLYPTFNPPPGGDFFFALSRFAYSFGIASSGARIIVTVIFFSITWAILWMLAYKLANFISRNNANQTSA
ncbi:MAG TPA: hypothetical protein VNS32_02235 [Flavisolibacter sp.]|nr:hypothetical protein [Flavisolibacter sp.]